MPVHPHLTDPVRPTRQRTPISPTTAYTGCPRCASETSPGRLGDRQVVPCFHGLFSVGMSSPETPGSSSAAYTQFLHRRRWPSLPWRKSRHFPLPPPSDSRKGFRFRGFPAVHLRYNPPTCSPPLSELTRITPANRGFYFRAFNGLITRTLGGYNCGGDWASSTGGTFTH